MTEAIEKEYEVLARKYRPSKLDELIGQEVLVTTLTNAIESNRVPHAFILTGIRGIGKTSTARIIAKCLNYAGSDGQQAMTAKLKDDCEQCRAIDQGRHPDVLELDAASRTGVNDMRELIESINYRPVMGRYKVYIIDEVHMLSRSAFNALLKTLEEPPEHTKFIFATTEIQKVPVTILSRCMRFDLPRINTEQLSLHLLNISEKEGALLLPNAAKAIAVAAEGSVRDGLSLLDQAIGGATKGDEISDTQIRKMLGIANKDGAYGMIESLIEGDAGSGSEVCSSGAVGGCSYCNAVLCHAGCGYCGWPE